jgi:hypothetical protein
MDKKIHEEIDPREQAHREAQKKHKNTPVIIFNNVLSSIINDPKVTLIFILFYHFNKLCSINIDFRALSTTNLL